MFFSNHRKLLLIVSLCLIILGASIAVIVATNRKTPSPTPTASLDATPEESELTGTLECLPKKNTGGPVTLECAYGLKATSGNFYALDTTFFPASLMDIPIGQKVKVVGIITPKEKLTSTQLGSYDIAGSILLSDLDRE